MHGVFLFEGDVHLKTKKNKLDVWILRAEHQKHVFLQTVSFDRKGQTFLRLRKSLYPCFQVNF